MEAAVEVALPAAVAVAAGSELLLPTLLAQIEQTLTCTVKMIMTIGVPCASSNHYY